MIAARGRARLIAELDRYRPEEFFEKGMAQRIREFVDANERCLERSNLFGHLTGSAWVVDRECTAALLTHHRQLRKWLQLGGHADGDHDLRAVAQREAIEESGISPIVPALPTIYDVDVHAIPARANEPAHLHFDVRYAFFADRNAVPHRTPESLEVAWVPLGQIARLGVDDSVLRLVEKTESLRGL